MPVYKKPNKIAVKFVDFSPLIYVSLLSFVSLLYRRKACLVLSLYMYTVYIYSCIYLYMFCCIFMFKNIIYRILVFLYISVYIRLCFIQKTKHIDLSINSCIECKCECMYSGRVCLCLHMCVSWMDLYANEQRRGSGFRYLLRQLSKHAHQKTPQACVCVCFGGICDECLFVWMYVCSILRGLEKHCRQIYCSKNCPIFSLIDSSLIVRRFGRLK